MLDEKWRKVMDEEIKAIVKNNSGNLSLFPKVTKLLMSNGSTRWRKIPRLDRKAQGKASYKRLYSKGRHQLWWCTCPCCLTGNYKINHFISSGRFFKWIWTLLFWMDSSKRKSTSNNHQTMWWNDIKIKL